MHGFIVLKNKATLYLIIVCLERLGGTLPRRAVLFQILLLTRDYDYRLHTGLRHVYKQADQWL